MTAFTTHNDNLLGSVDDVLSHLSDEGDAFENSLRVAHALWQANEKIDEALGELKTEIRKKASDLMGEPSGNMSFPVPDTKSVCNVNVPAPSFKVRKNADMDALKAALGPAFATFFEEKVSYDVKPNFEAHTVKVAGENPGTLNLVMGVIEQTAGTPRVSFKKK